MKVIILNGENHVISEFSVKVFSNDNIGKHIERAFFDISKKCTYINFEGAMIVKSKEFLSSNDLYTIREQTTYYVVRDEIIKGRAVIDVNSYTYPNCNPFDIVCDWLGRFPSHMHYTIQRCDNTEIFEIYKSTGWKKEIKDNINFFQHGMVKIIY